MSKKPFRAVALTKYNRKTKSFAHVVVYDWRNREEILDQLFAQFFWKRGRWERIDEGD